MTPQDFRRVPGVVRTCGESAVGMRVGRQQALQRGFLRVAMSEFIGWDASWPATGIATSYRWNPSPTGAALGCELAGNRHCNHASPACRRRRIASSHIGVGMRVGRQQVLQLGLGQICPNPNGSRDPASWDASWPATGIATRKTLRPIWTKGCWDASWPATCTAICDCGVRSGLASEASTKARPAPRSPFRETPTSAQPPGKCHRSREGRPEEAGQGLAAPRVAMAAWSMRPLQLRQGRLYPRS
jgi:hypothetical protein